MKQKRNAPRLNRRSFMQSAALAATPLVSPFQEKPTDPATPPADYSRKIKIGIVGCGGRGSWIARLFQKHPGYEFVAVADYFPENADRCGKSLGVPPERQFSGLSGYQKVITSGIEAIVLETPPYFFPEHAAAAVDAGLHVYMAKPVATDVPGCLKIEELGKKATQKRRCYFVDYQMPTDPINIEIVKRIHEGAMGKLDYLVTLGFCSYFEDPPYAANLESRLQRLIWVNDIALGCDYIGNYDIHAIDVALWVAGKRPVAASGSSRICRPNPHGDSRDVCSVVYEFDDGLVLNHCGEAMGDHNRSVLTCQVFGGKASAEIVYWGNSFLRGGAKPYRGGEVVNLYEAGAVRNIARFYENVSQGDVENPTVRRAVDGALTTILGREAGIRHARLTMDQILKENKRLEVNLSGLKA
jgi:myo-inositol 2-dehydrogenase/D-chiro-inositol 1-dehydrogenase